MKKTIALLLSAILLCTLLCACGKKEAASASAYDGTHPLVQFTIEKNDEIAGGAFTMELYPEYAPQTVDNFIRLVQDHFYDGLTFHRVVDGIMAQGGDPSLSGRSDSAQTIPGEFQSNGFAQNTLQHTRGVVSMARSNDPDSASSQFFICYDAAAFLDGNYAAFGKVIEGMDVVDSFTTVQRSYNALGEAAEPLNPIVIASAVVVDNAQ